MPAPSPWRCEGLVYNRHTDQLEVKMRLKTSKQNRLYTFLLNGDRVREALGYDQQPLLDFGVPTAALEEGQDMATYGVALDTGQAVALVTAYHHADPDTLYNLAVPLESLQGRRPVEWSCKEDEQ